MVTQSQATAAGDPETPSFPLRGRCLGCSEEHPKDEMKRHVAQHLGKTVPTRSPGAKTSTAFHVYVESAQWQDYWLHLLVPASAKLSDIDSFLRRTWLECCGHLSQFIVGRTRYVVHAEEPEERTMNQQVVRVLQPGMVAEYEYDFGTTTPLRITVISRAAATDGGRSPTLLARNNPPPVDCFACKTARATLVCSQCVYDSPQALCDACGPSHKCGEEMLLPFANSPRAGQCGYAGPEDPSP